MALLKRTATPTMPLAIDRFKKLGLTADTLAAIKPVRLTDAATAKQLGVSLNRLTTAVVLSTNKPRAGKKYLTMFSAMLAMADPRDTNNISIFSSAFPTAVTLGIQVQFDPISASKKHLVEFNITINEPGKEYKFRVFQYPTSTFQDLTITTSQAITVLIDPVDGLNSYGAEISQLNTKADACGWIFHSVKITSVG
jgi:hypothetical protein